MRRKCGAHLARIRSPSARPIGVDQGSSKPSAGGVSAESVAHVLDQRARARRVPPPIDVPLPDDPRIRDLRVTPHALGGYDRLAETDSEDDNEPG